MRQFMRLRVFATATIALGIGLQAHAATITIVNADSAGEGFNDNTSVSPEGGNSGTTRGAQRLQLFQAAASVWASKLDSDVTIKVSANFDPLTPCSTSGGVLGSAGPTAVDRDFTGRPRANSWYVIAESEAITGINDNGTSPEITARFNSDVDTGCLGAGSRFWYGTNPNIAVPSNRIALFPVVLHEIGHGLGFISLVCTQSGGCGGGTVQGSQFDGRDDAWSVLMRDRALNLTWSQMTDAQRANSMDNDPNLVWDGAAVTAGLSTFQTGSTGTNGSGSNRRLRLHAPTPVAPGSSVSHFTSAAASPNLLMEPGLSSGVFADVDLTVPLFQDIGWPLTAAAPNQPPVLTRPASIQVTEDVASIISGISVSDPDAGSTSLTLTFSVPAGTFNALTCTGVTSAGTTAARTLTGTTGNLNSCIASGMLRYTTAQNSTASVSLTVTANDNGNTGAGGAQTDTEIVTLLVTAVNDAPVISAPASIGVAEDVPTALAGISFTDVDSGAGFLMVTLAVPTGSVDAMTCSGVSVSGGSSSRRFTGTLTQLNTCFAGANRPRFTTALNATVNVTLTVSITDNGNTGTGVFGNDSDTLTLNVSAVNDAPVLSLPASITVPMPGPSPLTGIDVADVDSASADVRLTLTVPIGTLVATASGGVTVTGSNSAALQLTGTIAELNAFLDAGAARYSAGGETTLTLTLNDLGASGAGGAMTAMGSVPLIAAALFANGFE